MPMTPLTGLDRTSPTFKTDLDTFFLSSLPQFVTEANALEAAVEVDKTAAADSAEESADSAVAADASAVAAADSAVTAGQMAALAEATIDASSTSPFVSGQTVAAGDVRYSTSNYQTYRRTASLPGASTVDPALDRTRWAQLSVSPGEFLIAAMLLY